MMITKTLTAKSVNLGGSNRVWLRDASAICFMAILLEYDSVRKGKADYITNYSKENGGGHGHSP